MWFFAAVIGFNLIKVPYDSGANKRGSSFFPDEVEKIVRPNIIYKTCTEKTLHEKFQTVYNIVERCHKKNEFPVIVGGDHTIAIPSVYASNEYCLSNQKRLGILWMDAHADFNTLETSPSKNLHGVPVAALCGHTLGELTYGKHLEPSQFSYYGVRDIDCLEFNRFQEYNMKVHTSVDQVCEWIKCFDAIHISFDVDCLDPSIMKSVNTPVENGLSLLEAKTVLETVKKSKKLLALDIVEFNPKIDVSNMSTISKLFKNFVQNL